jgi:hypothetical protein
MSGLARAPFEATAHAVGVLLPESALVFAREFSGSLHYYAGVQTLRWDVLDANDLKEAIGQLEQAGHPLFALLNAQNEEPAFRSRFADHAHRLQAVRSFSGSAEQLTLYRVLPISQRQ